MHEPARQFGSEVCCTIGDTRDRLSGIGGLEGRRSAQALSLRVPRRRRPLPAAGAISRAIPLACFATLGIHLPSRDTDISRDCS